MVFKWRVGLAPLCDLQDAAFTVVSQYMCVPECRGVYIFWGNKYEAHSPRTKVD